MLIVTLKNAEGTRQLSWRQGDPRLTESWEAVESIRADGDELELIFRKFPNLNQYMGGESTVYVSDDARFVYANLLMDSGA